MKEPRAGEPLALEEPTTVPRVPRGRGSREANSRRTNAFRDAVRGDFRSPLLEADRLPKKPPGRR